MIFVSYPSRASIQHVSPSEKGRDVHGSEYKSICCQLGRNHLPGGHSEGSIGENMEVAIPGVAEVGEQRAIRCVDGHFLPIYLLLHARLSLSILGYLRMVFA